jgi:ActR/RegA family two-component response regulator
MMTMNNTLHEDVNPADAEQTFRRHLRAALEKRGFEGQALETKIETLMAKGRTMPFDWRSVSEQE